jgi:hypothetical protein
LSDWSRRFDDPIPLPNGRELVTLKDAGDYITKLPQAEPAAPEWQTAMKGADPGRRERWPHEDGADGHHAGAAPA